MKKIATAVAAMAMAATMFAVDFSTTVQVKGDIAWGTDKTVNVLGFENTEQKDADLLEVHFAGDKAGADFKFWTTAKDSVLNVRALDVWFCPVDAVKISLGNVTSDLYKERLNWWKVPLGQSKVDMVKNGWNPYPRWSSYSTVEGFGAKVDVNLDVLGGLALSCGVTPSASLLKAEKDKDVEIGAYGVQAKLNVADGVSVGVAWRDAGTKNYKILAAGADYAAGDFYGFLQGRMFFDKKGDDVSLSGVAIDNYFSYNFGFMQLDGTIPVTIRGIRDDNDPSYMTARIRVGIPMDSVKLNVVLGSDEGANNGPASSAGGFVWTLDETFGDSFNFYVNPSVDFNVGVCALNVGAEISISNSKTADKVETAFNWAVPFTAKVAF